MIGLPNKTNCVNKDTQSAKMTELALSVLINNDNVFKDLTKEQTITILLTFKDAKHNKSIQQMQVKYMVYSIYNKLHSAVISLVFANKKQDLDKIIASQADINTCFHKIQENDMEVQESFSRLLVAEFKELVYNSKYDPCFEKIEDDIMTVYENIVPVEDALNHKHDPTHYMFSEKPYWYSFYEMLECNGGSVFDDVSDDPDEDVGDEDVQDDEDW
jgi:hypothetical protein